MGCGSSVPVGGYAQKPGKTGKAGGYAGPKVPSTAAMPMPKLRKLDAKAAKLAQAPDTWQGGGH
jgi:hypothetical protein